MSKTACYTKIEEEMPRQSSLASDIYSRGRKYDTCNNQYQAIKGRLVYLELNFIPSNLRTLSLSVHSSSHL